MVSTIYKIQQLNDDFSKTELKIAQYILKNKKIIPSLNTEELANKAGVSQAAVTRFSKKISGSGGFPALKMGISNDNSENKEVLDEINPKDSTNDIKNKLAFKMEQTISNSKNEMVKENIEQTAQLIDSSNNVYIYGLGASNTAAGDLEQKLLRVGKNVFQTLDTHLLASAMTVNNKSAILFIISNTGEKTESLQLVELANKLNIKVIAITSDTKNSLASKSKIILKSDNSTENSIFRTAATSSLISQLYIVDLIYYLFLKINFNDKIQLLDESKKSIEKYFSK